MVNNTGKYKAYRGLAVDPGQTCNVRTTHASLDGIGVCSAGKTFRPSAKDCYRRFLVHGFGFGSRPDGVEAHRPHHDLTGSCRSKLLEDEL